jgi:hypothetical protein
MPYRLSLLLLLLLYGPSHVIHWSLQLLCEQCLAQQSNILQHQLP